MPIHINSFILEIFILFPFFRINNKLKMTESKRLKNELGVANNDYIQAVLNELVINVELKVLREKNTTLNESLTQLKKFLTGGTQIKRINELEAQLETSIFAYFAFFLIF